MVDSRCGAFRMVACRTQRPILWTLFSLLLLFVWLGLLRISGVSGELRLAEDPVDSWPLTSMWLRNGVMFRMILLVMVPLLAKIEDISEFPLSSVSLIVLFRLLQGRIADIGLKVL